MSPTNRPQSGDTKQLQFIDIDDFTPGIYSNSDISFSAPPNTVPGPLPAPTGSADAAQTFQCIALPGGGLGPLPGVVHIYDLTDLGITDPTVAGYVAGLHPTLMTPNDEFVVYVEYQSAGDNHVRVWSGVVGTGSGHLLYSNDVATPTGGGIAGAPFMFATRVAPSNPTTTIGQIVIAIPVSAVSDLILYPDPSAPTVFGVYDFMTSLVLQAFGHQNRIVVIEPNAGNSWPLTTPVDTNSDILNYTDPPNSETFPALTPGIVFVAEEPYGYGAVGSISAGELFLVKCRGGGVVVQGDINNPTVTFLPGVRETGEIYGHADSNEAGLFYCSHGGTGSEGGGGAHLWGGGNVSQKISQQLDDNFFLTQFNSVSQSFAYFCKGFDGRMLFSNNWLYDTQTNSWWRFLNPATASVYWICEGFLNNQFYAAVPAVASVATPFLYRFDKTVPASSWQWQSLPIRVSEDRYVDLREVAVRYSNPYGGSGTFTMTVSAVDQAGNVVAAQPLTWNSAVNRPQNQRFNIRCQSEDLTIRVAVQANTAGQPAPVIHSISAGYRTRQHTGPTE